MVSRTSSNIRIDPALRDQVTTEPTEGFVGRFGGKPGKRASNSPIVMPDGELRKNPLGSGGKGHLLSSERLKFKDLKNLDLATYDQAVGAARDLLPEALHRLMDIINNSENEHAVVKAIDILFHRAYGKPVERIETKPEQAPPTINVLFPQMPNMTAQATIQANQNQNHLTKENRITIEAQIAEENDENNENCSEAENGFTTAVTSADRQT